jgi:4-amino-4-deoxy-L-arabinose transferase-like glycosyltransferase
MRGSGVSISEFLLLIAVRKLLHIKQIQMIIFKSQIKTPLLLSLAFGVLFFLSGVFFLGLPEISGSSEAREAHIASEILRSGEWILPRRNEVIPSKPPLYHWITAIVGKTVLPEGAMVIPPRIARAPSLFFASLILAGTVFAAFKIGTLLEQSNAISSGIASGVILALCYPFVSAATLSMVDMVYVGCSLSAVFIALFYPLYRVSFYIILACAVLGKGPIGLAIPLLCLGVVFIVNPLSRNSLINVARPSLGWVVFIVLVVSWYGAASVHGGEAFIRRQILFENIERFAGGENITIRKWWFYFPQFLKFAFPWSLFFFWLIIKEVRSFCHKRPSLSPEMSSSALMGKKLLQAFALVVLAGLVALSIPAGKRHIYLLPFYPFMAIFLGVRLNEFIHKSQHKIALILISIVATGYGLILSLSLWATKREISGSALIDESFAYIAKQHQLLLVVGALGLFASLLLIHKKFSPNRLLYVTCIAMPLIMCIVQLQFGVKSHLKGFYKAAHEINAYFPTQKLYAIKGTFDEELDPLLYYLGREVTLINPKQYLSTSFVNATLIALGKDEKLVESNQWKIFQRYSSIEDRVRGRTDRSIAIFVPTP